MFSCRDFGRITCIVDDTGNPYVLNVTADLDLAPGGSIFRSGALDRYSYSDLFEEIISAVIRRLNTGEAEGGGDAVSQSLSKTSPETALPGAEPLAADSAIRDI